MNTINRHNYEEFFLLYIDAELDPVQRAAVEVFVQQNPDLAAELEMMQQLRLEPEEDIKFYNKAELLRTETPSINTTNYEEYFLLYVDNELTPAEKDAVEKFVLQHPALQEEFSLLKQTVLAPEIIEFGDKQSLYRKEEEERRVVPFNWTRLAVAAAVAGLGIVALWLFTRPQQQTGTGNNTVAVVKDTPRLKQDNEVAVVPKHNDDKVAVKAPDTAIKEDVVNSQVADNKNTGVNDNTPVIQPKQERSNELIAAVDTHDVSPHAEETAAVTEPVKQETTTTGNEASAHPINTSVSLAYNTQQQETAALPLVYKELDTQQDEKSLYVGALNLNKDKVKGLFKKVGQIFGDKTRSISDNESGKLQVANLEFDTKK